MKIFNYLLLTFFIINNLNSQVSTIYPKYSTNAPEIVIESITVYDDKTKIKFKYTPTNDSSYFIPKYTYIRETNSSNSQKYYVKEFVSNEIGKTYKVIKDKPFNYTLIFESIPKYFQNIEIREPEIDGYEPWYWMNIQLNSTPKPKSKKYADLYFFFEDKMVTGEWTGEIKYTDGKPLAHGFGKFIAKERGGNYIAYNGNTRNGKMHGNGYYYDDLGGGKSFSETTWKYGLPDGKFIFKGGDGSYMAGNLENGLLKGVLSIKSAKRSELGLIKVNCDGLRFLNILRGQSLSSCNVYKDEDSDNLLIGIGILFAGIHLLTDEHSSISQAINCAVQYGVSNLVENPIYAGAASEAVNSLFKNESYSWKNMGQSTVENYLSNELKDSGYSTLAKSAGFISYMNCIVQDSK